MHMFGKKLTAYILSTGLMILACCGVCADTGTVDGVTWAYTVSNGVARIDRVSPMARGSLIVPTELGGGRVESIGPYAFDSRSRISSVVIPEGVTSLGVAAFYNCTGLASVTIPASVTNLPFYAFYGCRRLKSVTIPPRVENLEAYAFAGCSGLTAVSIPEGVTSIGGCAFDGCSNLVSVTIPVGVKDIGGVVFRGCSSLTSLSFPEGVTNIGDYALSGCSSLTSFAIPEHVTSIGVGAFNGCSKLTSLVLPENVSSIGDYTFSGCSDLVSVMIPEGVTSIGVGSFYGCRKLDSLAIPEGVTRVGEFAFRGCSGLTSVIVPSCIASLKDMFPDSGASLTNVTIYPGWTKVAGGAFSGCSRLTSLTIPAEVTSIEEDAFYGCSSLTSLTIPAGVTSIGDHAFSGCSSLTSLTIPAGVTSIGEGVFSNCASLEALTVETGNTAYRMVEDCLIARDGCLLTCAPAPRELTIPSEVTSIGEGALSGRKGLTSLTIPSNVTRIGDGAFAGTGIKSVFVPLTVTDYGEAVFPNNCTVVRQREVEIIVSGQTADHLYDGAPPRGFELSCTNYPAATQDVVCCSTALAAAVNAGRHQIRFAPEEFCNTNKTWIATFIIASDADFNIVPRPVTLTSVSAVDRYDGAPFMCNEVSVGGMGFVGGDGVTCTCTGSQTDLGSSTNTFSFVFNPGTSAGNYAVTVKYGILKVVSSTVDILVSYDWLEKYYPGTVDYEARIQAPAANGMGRVADAYVAGVDPTDPSAAFTARVVPMSDGSVKIAYSPDLGEARKYTVFGKRKLADETWTEITAGQEKNFHFFKVRVDLP